jgi:uncharacterized protein YxeA
MFDDLDILGLLGFAFILIFAVLYWVIIWTDRNSPFVNTRRNVAGRRRMATDWEKPGYLPEKWQ